MFTWSGLITGLVMIVLGVLGIKYTFWVHNITGPMDWLEQYTGSGSTYGIYKILSVFVVIIGVIWATGFGHNLLEFLLSPLSGLFHPPGG